MSTFITINLFSRNGFISIPYSYDLDLPCDCDDEYWEHPDPELAFKQPPGRPSSVAYFLTLLKLHSITGRALHQLVRQYLPPIFENSIDSFLILAVWRRKEF